MVFDTYFSIATDIFSNFYLFTDEIIPKGNPFKMPPDSDIFLLRDKERQRKKQVHMYNLKSWLVNL